ncbi:MAG: universal stress protein [Bacteroidota bacterium]
MKMKKLLVPIDFSELSLQALEAAGELAKLFDAQITPFHAYIPISELDGPYSLGLGPSVPENFVDMEETLTDRMNTLVREHVDSKYLKHAVVEVGNPAHCIVEAGKEHDMIIMGTHGRTGFSRMLLGSVAEKTLRLSHVPVLILEEESILTPLKKILVTTDFSENSYSIFPFAKAIAEKTGADIDLIHVLSYNQFDDDSTAQTFVNLREQRLNVVVKEYFHDISSRVNTEVLVSSDTPHETIYNLNTEREYNLIAMATVGRTGIDYMMMGSTTGNVVRHVSTPVLSFNPKKPELEEEIED